MAVAGDTWWATNIDLDTSGETQDLSLADRTVYVDFRLTDAAGQTATLPDEKITWKIMTVGEERTETRYKTVDGETVSYEVTVTDHLVQTGEKMIVAADPNICYVDDPPPATQVQITNSQYPVPEVWKDADTSERASPNWVHEFDTEGHWVLKGSFTCWPGDTEDESTIDKTGQTIVGEEKTTTIHVMKPLTIRRVGVWHEDQLPDTAEEWNSIEEEEEGDGEGSLDGATYALYELPKASTYTEWIRYYIVGGAVADPKGAWAEKTDPDPKRLWWSQRLHLGSNKIEYLAEYNGLLLSHARDDDSIGEFKGEVDLIADNNWKAGKVEEGSPKWSFVDDHSDKVKAGSDNALEWGDGDGEPAQRAILPIPPDRSQISLPVLRELKLWRGAAGATHFSLAAEWDEGKKGALRVWRKRPSTKEWQKPEDGLLVRLNEAYSLGTVQLAHREVRGSGWKRDLLKETFEKWGQNEGVSIWVEGLQEGSGHLRLTLLKRGQQVAVDRSLIAIRCPKMTWVELHAHPWSPPWRGFSEEFPNRKVKLGRRSEMTLTELLGQHPEERMRDAGLTVPRFGHTPETNFGDGWRLEIGFQNYDPCYSLGAWFGRIPAKARSPFVLQKTPCRGHLIKIYEDDPDAVVKNMPRKLIKGAQRESAKQMKPWPFQRTTGWHPEWGTRLSWWSLLRPRATYLRYTMVHNRWGEGLIELDLKDDDFGTIPDKGLRKSLKRLQSMQDTWWGGRRPRYELLQHLPRGKRYWMFLPYTVVLMDAGTWPHKVIQTMTGRVRILLDFDHKTKEQYYDHVVRVMFHAEMDLGFESARQARDYQGWLKEELARQERERQQSKKNGDLYVRPPLPKDADIR